MNTLKNEFIRRSIADLEEIRRKLNSFHNEGLPENFSREIFRKLHTIKGTAQTFNFPVAARLAHRLEGLLSGIPFGADGTKTAGVFLSEGIEFLIISLQKADFQIPADFSAKLHEFQPALPAIDFSSHFLPENTAAKLSLDEKKLLSLAQAQGKELFILEIGFPAAGFAENFRAFRRQIEKKGEIIAVLADPQFAAENKIGFQIIFAGRNFSEAAIEQTEAKIVFRFPPHFSNDLHGVLSNVALYGKNLAEKLGRDCEFIISADPLSLSAEKLKLIFDILLHLVRNAVDHGIRQKGKIEISVRRQKEGLFLTVGDDGRGIDTNKIQSLAAGQNLIEAGNKLLEREIIDLIFVPGFTTVEKLSEISGRGTGLDAVKTFVESAGGTIDVKSAAGKGAAFEIFLPEETPAS